MKIDWFTVIAQIINFLILVWLLKRFLYKPVLNAMNKREQRIADRLLEAQAKSRQAEEEKGKYLELQQEVRDSAKRKMQEAKQQADAFREKLVASAKEEVAEKRLRWLEAIEKEKAAFLEQTSHMIGMQFTRFAHSVIRELADTSLEEKIVEVFFRKLSKLSDHDRESIKKQIAAKPEPIVVSTTFDLKESLQKEVSQQLTGMFGERAKIQFRKDEKLVVGISLEAGGKKIRWDVDYYLEKFGKALTASLEMEKIS